MHDHFSVEMCASGAMHLFNRSTPETVLSSTLKSQGTATADATTTAGATVAPTSASLSRPDPAA
ncbi:hypothetical protein HaLaN_08932 [Haematococcus lacustris]|uniref:Uncharacterized protein n=1 Tax=Haematococcus lacustris TaxID=44745 RepID=A0A699Z1G7_HAELA|nr:hypothetical protein HaLaN_08932 [Haematococcus lacustris]